MKFTTTLVLLVLLVGVGAYFLLVERGREPGPSPSAEVGEGGQPLLDDPQPERASVRQLAVSRDGEQVVLFREDAGWWQVEPVRFAVSRASAEELVDGVLALRWRQRFEPGGDDQPTLADVGLETPRAEVTVTARERAWTIRLGRRTLDGQGYLMLDGDDHVYIVGDALHRAVLDGTIRDWRRRSLDGPRAAQTDRVTLERAGETIELAKREGRWYLDAEGRERASRQAVETLVSSVRSLSIASFVADAPERLRAYGLDEPTMTLTLDTPSLGVDEGDDEAASAFTYVLRIGAPADLRDRQHYATWSVDEAMSPVVFTLEQRGADRLAVSRDELRDPRIVTVASNQVSELLIERPGQPPLHLLRDVDRGFRFSDDGPGYQVDYNTASELMEAITETEATGYVVAFQPDGEPEARITLTRRSGQTEHVRLYADTGSDAAEDGETSPSYLAVRNDESVAYRVAVDEMTGLFVPLTAFRDMELMNVRPNEVAGVTLQRDDGATFTFVRDDERWRLDGHDAFEARALDGLLASLRPLRAADWLDEPVDAGTGDGWAVLTVETADGSPRVLHVDARTGRGMLVDEAMGFELPDRFVEQLRAEYRPRTVLSLAEGEVGQVRREHDGRTLTLRRTAGGSYLSDGDTAVRESAAAALFDRLASLRVWRYIDEPDDVADGPERRYVIEQSGEADGSSYVLELWRVGGVRTVGRLGDRWFQLDRETLDVLYASLLEDEAAVEFDEADDVPVAAPAVDLMK